MRSTTTTTAAAAARLATLASGVVVPVADWVVAENDRPGTLDWIPAGRPAPHDMEGFASTVSAVAGEEVTLYVNTTARTFHVEAYRMGYYQGLGGRLVWRSPDAPGTVQPPPVLLAPTNTVECHWSPSIRFGIDGDWPPGAYVLKLVGDGGQEELVPLCVRDDASAAAFVIQHAVTDWQAYNRWGGYSLYDGLVTGGFRYSQTPRDADFAHRARIVSFDRPYPTDWMRGTADFFGNEFPVVFHMERLGLDLTYWTDVDLHLHPERLLQHRCLLSLGHDEYWSLEMRDGALQARSAGVNLAFLGANACYRQIRLEPSPVGPARHEVCYKSAAEDPETAIDPVRSTAVAWVDGPVPWAEQLMIGAQYQAIGADADLVVTDPSSWVWAGTGVTAGQHLPHVVQGEYDRYDPAYPGPPDVEIVAHSPVTNNGMHNASDITWYTVPGGGGVFAVGMASWVNKLSDSTRIPTNWVAAPIPGVTEILLRVMENVYSTLGTGPASLTHPSRPSGS